MLVSGRVHLPSHQKSQEALSLWCRVVVAPVGPKLVPLKKTNIVQNVHLCVCVSRVGRVKKNVNEKMDIFQTSIQSASIICLCPWIKNKAGLRIF